MYLINLTRKEKIIEAKKLRKQGLSFEKIAKQLHISTTTANKYPLIGQIFKIISDFKSILIKKDLNKFAEGINNVSSLKIKELDGKGIKRIMYGRNNLELLRSKVIQFRWSKKGFITSSF